MAAAEVGALRVTVGADITGLTKGMNDAQRQVSRSAGAMRKSVSDLQLTFKEVATFSSRIFRTGALVFGGAFGAQQILSIADAAKNLQAQLRLATAQFGSFAQAQKDVQGIAERSRSDLSATAELYSALMRNSDQFGASQTQVARVTETVSKAFKISGASADEAANATRQLVQAFTSGRLQGDEFRSMMENAPRLARLLSDSLGVTVGQLRQMSKEGKLTADALVNAFSNTKFTKGIDEEFSQLPVTFDQAMGQVYNAAVIVFGAFDSGGQFSNSLANFAADGTKNFSDLAESASEWGATFRGVIDSLDVVHQALGELQTQGVQSLFGIQGSVFSLRDALVVLGRTIDIVANGFVNFLQGPGNAVRTLLGMPAITGQSNFAGSMAQAYDRAVGNQRRAALGDRIESTIRGKAPPPFHAPATSSGGKGSGRAKQAPRDRSDDATFQMDRELLQAQSELLRAQQELAGTVGDRSEIALKLLDNDRAQFDLEQDEKLRKAQRDLSEKKITQNAYDELVATDAKVRAVRDEADIAKRTAIMQEARVHRLERADALEQRGFDQQAEALRFQDEQATTAEDHRRIQLDIIDLLYKQKEAHLRSLKAQLDVAGKTEEAADVQAEINQLPIDKARDQDRARRGTMGPLEQWAKSVPQTASEITEALQGIQVQGFEGLSDAIANVISGTESLKDAFSDVAKSIIADLIRMSIRMLIFRALSSVMGGAFGGGGMDVSGNAALDSVGVPGFAMGGGFNVLGRRGIDSNVLALNGLPIAKVSYGERINVSNDNSGGGGITINQTIAPNFAGNAATKDDLVQMAVMTKAATLDAVRQGNRRA